MCPSDELGLEVGFFSFLLFFFFYFYFLKMLSCSPDWSQIRYGAKTGPILLASIPPAGIPAVSHHIQPSVESQSSSQTAGSTLHSDNSGTELPNFRATIQIPSPSTPATLSLGDPRAIITADKLYTQPRFSVTSLCLDPP